MFRNRVTALVACLTLALAAGTGAVVDPAPAAAAAPEAPTGLSPSGGESVDGRLVLAWQRPAGATRFDVQVAATADFAKPLVSVTGTANERYVPVVALPGGELWWRVRASNGSEVSDWSTDSFRRADQASPVPIRPAAGAVITPPVDTPRFAWEPVGGATGYTVQVSPDREFTDPALIIQSVQRSTAAVLTGYQRAGTYFWRVGATLGPGISTQWSEPQRYDVRGLSPATAVFPVVGGATNPSDPNQVGTVVLDWQPVPGAVTYHLQVSTDNGFLAVVHERQGVTGTRYSPPEGLNNDEYYWRVRAVDASGNPGPWPVAPWQFRRAWPDQPRLVHPQGDLGSSTAPFFYEWEPIEGASSYRVVLYDAEGRHKCTSAPTMHTTLANSTCMPTATGQYYWKVQGLDQRPSGAIGAVTDLISQEPGAFRYVVPAADSGPLASDTVSGEAVAMSGTAAYGVGRAREVCAPACHELRQTPVLTWDPVPGAGSYLLTLSRDRELTNVIQRFTVTSPLWTATATLPDSQAGAAYYWTVQPCDTTSVSTCAPPQHAEQYFAKKSVPPALVGSLERAVQDDVTLEWGTALAAVRDPRAAAGSSLATPASTEARSYVVQVSTDPAFGTLVEEARVDQTTFTSFANTYPEGPLYWRVRAEDGTGNPTVWSVTGRLDKQSSPPTLTDPADGADLGSDYALSWAPLPFAAAYEVEVYAGSTKVGGSASWKHVAWAPSDPFAVAADGYTWRVRRIDAKGRKGAWSDVRRFGSPGATPALVAPSEGGAVAPTAALFTWEPLAGASSYRFERRLVGGSTLAESLVTRATGWAPTTALAGGDWEWRVVALDSRSNALGASPWRGVVVSDAPTVVTPVTIAGTGRVGSELRSSPPTFDPAVDQTSYQWFRGTTAITGATGTTYTVTAQDEGKALTVRATGTLAGYKPAVSTSNAITGTSGDAPRATQPPVVTGRAAAGNRLTVQPGAWTEPARLTYQWYRDGEPVAGATRTTFDLRPDDAGRLVHVVETALASGREPGTSASQAVRVDRLPSTTTLRLSATRATTRQRVTATAGVTVAGLAAPGGTVTFRDGSRKLGTVRLGSGSSAVFRLPRLAPGRHTIRAVYSGSSQVAASARVVRLTIVR